MRTIKRLLYRELLLAIATVTLGFLALIFFFDVVDELPSIHGPYHMGAALLFVLLQVPGHVYELLPIATLIGTILALARFAQSSEFTILRVSGFTPQMALKTLLTLGLGLVALTFVVGDYLAPLSAQSAQLLKAARTGNITVGQTGAWLKEKQPYSRYAVNVGSLSGDGQMHDVRIFEFNNDSQFVSMLQAPSARFDNQAWLLMDATHTEFPMNLPLKSSLDLAETQDVEAVQNLLQQHDLHVAHHSELRWPTELSFGMISAALLKPERMGTLNLWRYMQHLKNNGQDSQVFEIEFWRKIVYPLSALVMLTLALPFAYLHFRSGSIAGLVFVGVLIGMSFFLLNAVFGFIGNISAWNPLLAAATPSLLYSGAALVAFRWIVLTR